MASITIHNIPDDLLREIKQAATRNGRALEDEALLRLSNAVAVVPRIDRSPEEEAELRRRAAEMRGRATGAINEQLLRAARNEWR